MKQMSEFTSESKQNQTHFQTFPRQALLQCLFDVVDEGFFDRGERVAFAPDEEVLDALLLAGEVF